MAQAHYPQGTERVFRSHRILLKIHSGLWSNY